MTEQKTPFVRKEKNLRDMLLNAKKKYGERDLLRVRTPERTVRGIKADTFLHDMNALGNALLEMGFADKKIALIGPTSYEWLISYFAIVCGVGVVVPVDKELQQDEIETILRESGAQGIIFAEDYTDIMKNIAKSIPSLKHFISMNTCDTDFSVNLYDLIKRDAQCGYEQREIDENAMSALLFTSGTTGKSKGVMLSHASIISASEGGLEYLTIGEVCLSVLPVHHSFECTHGIVMMIQNGTTICINDSLRNFTDNLVLFQPNAVFLVPLFIERLEFMVRKDAEKRGGIEKYEALLEQNREELAQGIDKRKEHFGYVRDMLGGHLDLLLCGGAPLSERLARTFREMGIMLINGYGITECSPLVAVNGNNAYRDGSVGRIIPCCEAKIVDADENGEGEILVQGSNVMLGYYENDTATAEATCDGWFDTGDIGHIDEDGYLFITGRKKNLIVLANGKNIYPEEIEEYIRRKIRYIAEMVVYAPMTEGMDERKLCAEIYLGDVPITDELRAQLDRDIAEVNRDLPTFKRIQRVHIRDNEFEKTTKKSIKRFKV
ncbi:MAG: AMP-binding protein [Christensenella sp.]